MCNNMPMNKKVLCFTLLLPLLTVGCNNATPPSEDQTVLTSISLSGNYKTEYYINESLDVTGLIVTANYSDNSSKQVEDYTLSDFDSSTVGEKQITVTYQTKTASFSVTVFEKGDIEPSIKPEPAKKVEATRIYNYQQSETVIKGYSFDLSPVVMPVNAVKNVKYLADDDEIIEVINNSVLGKKEGTSLLKIYNDNNDNDVLDNNEPFTVASFKVINGNPDSKIEIEQDIEVTVGESKNVSYTVEGIDVQTTSYGFYSSDESVASFAAGKLVAHKSGECDISLVADHYKGTSHVVVKDKMDGANKLASSVDIEIKTLVLNEGQNLTLTADKHYSLYPKDVSKNTPIRFVSEDNNILSVNNNTISAKKEGQVNLDVYLNDDEYPVNSFIVIVLKDGAEYKDSYYNNYYKDLTWENASDLRTKLKAIISKDKKSISYNNPTNWESNQDADFDLYDFSTMATIYGGKGEILKANTNQGWQREHCFAASLMTCTTTGNAVRTFGRATDFHNLYAAYQSGNSSRGNKNLGEVNKLAADYTDRDTYSFTRKWFEPTSTEDKGKVARAIFYMALMYDENEISTYTDSSQSLSVNMPGLNIIEENVGYERIPISRFLSPTSNEDIALVSYYKDLALKEDDSLTGDALASRAYEIHLEKAMPYAMGGLSSYLKWNSYDVTLEEMHHNESVYKYNSTNGKGCQNNRNPFVDYPELVNYLYGDLQNVAGSIKDLKPTYLSLEMDKDQIHHYAIGNNTDKTYHVGDTVTVESLDLKIVKNDLSIIDAPESAITTSYTFKEEDGGHDINVTLKTDKNDISFKAIVESGAASNYEKASSFDASKTYYLSPDGRYFANANITSKKLVFATSDIASVKFDLAADKTDEYIVTITGKDASIKLGYLSGTDLGNTATNWKVQSYNGGLVLIEASSGRFLGMESSTSNNAKAYAASNLGGSKYPPVYLYTVAN